MDHRCSSYPALDRRLRIDGKNFKLLSLSSLWFERLLIIIINSLYLCRGRRTDRTKKKQYNSKFTIVKVDVNLQSSVQVWFNSNIVLVINV